METSLIRHSNAIAARAANSTAFRFSTGKAPGSPRHTGHTLVFGGSPKRVEHEQKIFDAVSNCTWTSSPMTGSYFARRSSETVAVVAISGDYNWLQLVERRASPPGYDAASDEFSQHESGTGRTGNTPIDPSQDYYGLFASGALKYFSIGISKYISSLPLPSR